MAGFLINRKPQIIDLAILGNKVELIMTSESLPVPPAPLGRSASQIWHLNGVKCRSVRSKVIRWEPSLQLPYYTTVFVLRQAERTRGAGDLSPASKTGVITS